MPKKYIIRRIDFGYNDEYFTTDEPSMGAIEQVYSNKTQAEQAYKRLVVEGLEENDFESYSFAYGYASEESYAAVEAFMLEKTGEEYDKDDGVPELDEESLFEFAQLTGIMHYKLLEIDADSKFYVIWLPNSYSYFEDYETGNIASASTEHLILNEHRDDWDFLQALSNTLHGSLAELSDAPLLLEKVIDQHAGLTYAAEQQTLTIDGSEASFDALSELNALLKQPLFEIQAKTLEEFQAL